MNDELCTLDLSGPLTKEELREVENAANEAVFANVPVQISYPSKEKLKTLDYRSKIEIDGQVRIVTIPGYDVCACCAPHVYFTGEIGLIKLVQSQNYKGGYPDHYAVRKKGTEGLSAERRKREGDHGKPFSEGRIDC